MLELLLEAVASV